MASLLDLIRRVLKEGQSRRAKAPKPAPSSTPAPMTDEEREFLQALHEGSAQESQQAQQAQSPDLTERDRFLAGEWVETPTSSNVGRLHYEAGDGTLMVGYTHPDTPELTYWGYTVPVETALEIYDRASRGTALWDEIRVRGPGGKHLHQCPAWFISGPAGKNQQRVAARRRRRRRR